MNNVQLLGRIGNELKIVKGEKASFLKVSLAVNTGREEPYWFQTKAFNSIAEAILKNAKKGDLIMINGRLVPSDYTDDKGVKHYQTEVVIDSFYKVVL